MNKRVFLLALLSMSFTSYGNDVLTLETYIKLIKEESSEYKELNDVLKNASRHKLSSLQANTLDMKLTQNFKKLETEDKYNIQVDQNLRFTGTKLSLNYAKNEKDLTTVALEQSLYKDAFGRKHRTLETQINKETRIKLLSAHEDIEAFMASSINDYLNYKLAVADYKQAKILLSESKRLKRFVEKKTKSKIANRTDLNRVKLQVISREEDLYNKEIELTKLLSELNKNLSLTKIDSDYQVKESLQEVSMLITHHDKEKKQSRLIELAKLEVEVSKEKRAGFELDYKPDVKLIASQNEDDTRAGIQISYSFGDSKTKELIQTENTNSSRLEKKLIRTKRNYDKDLNEIQLKIKRLNKVVSLAKRKITLQKSVLDDDLKRYQVGKLSLDRIIELNNDYAQTRYGFNKNMIELDKAYAVLFELTDSLY